MKGSMRRQGKLIVLEGTDGSWKKTQTAILKAVLARRGFHVATAAFPSYGKPTARLVERYLNNGFGPATGMDPYLASMFYAIDRRENGAKIRALIAKNDVVLVDRYVDSNMHQGGK